MRNPAGRLGRGASVRLLARVVGTVVALAGLFAMHGMPMTMTAPMTMSSSLSSSLSSSMASTMSSSPMSSLTASTMSSSPMSSFIGVSAAATDASVPSATAPGGLPVPGVRGGCDVEHDGCAAVLRDPGHTPGPALVVAAAGSGRPSGAGSARMTGPVVGHAPPPSAPCLDELCISRT